MSKREIGLVRYVDNGKTQYYFWECPYCYRQFSTYKDPWERDTIICTCGALVKKGVATKTPLRY